MKHILLLRLIRLSESSLSDQIFFQSPREASALCDAMRDWGISRFDWSAGRDTR